MTDNLEQKARDAFYKQKTFRSSDLPAFTVGFCTALEQSKDEMEAMHDSYRASKSRAKNEIDRLQNNIEKDCKARSEEFSYFEEQLAAKDAQLQEAKEREEKLRFYASHRSSCKTQGFINSRCSCGLSEALSTSEDKCEHGKGLKDYCEPCGRIHTT